MESEEILAAGAVVSRKGPQVLLVHRPKYDDWSFPKGKLDPGEHALTAAVREVAEETGADIRLGPPLSDQRYATGNGTVRPKRVHYWAGRLVDKHDVASYKPNAEIDELVWLDVDKARKRLTYPHDRETLEEFLAVRKRSTPLIVLRHARAQAKRTWKREARERPLTAEGELQADELVPMLAAYGVERLVTSSSRRCWATLAPYADVTGLDLETSDDLAEEDATAEGVASVVADLLGDKRPTVLCTHRPVLPLVLDALDLPERELEKGEMLVVHHRKGSVVAVELHQP